MPLCTLNDLKSMKNKNTIPKLVQILLATLSFSVSTLAIWFFIPSLFWQIVVFAIVLVSLVVKLQRI